MGPKRKNARRFHGNRFTGNLVATSSTSTSALSSSSSTSSRPIASEPQTASQVKLATLANEEEPQECFGNRVVSLPLLINFVQGLQCQACKKFPKFSEERSQGLASTMKFSCECISDMTFNTSEASTSSSHQQINDRLQFAMYELGQNYEGAKNLCALLDLPPPVSSQSWNLNKKRIHDAVQKEAGESMKKAADEVKGAHGSEITVSCDGTWQRRGFSSKNGVVTVASVNGLSSKIIDTETLTNYCHGCSVQSEGHVCQKNHVGSAGAMETEGVKRIFSRSERLHDLKYTGYLGDGDSKSYKSLTSLDPPVYDNKPITKLECVGHIQKRMGRKLSSLVKDSKNKVFLDIKGKRSKGLGGKNKLTKSAIHKIQGHYGAAIRKHAGNEEEMRKAIWAIFNHRAGKHDDCGDWCPSKTNDIEKANKNTLPAFVIEEMRPVFESLTSHELLSKCTHGGTQNVNEAFHHIIWSLCPKEIFIGRDRLELAVASAVMQYNDGLTGKLNILAGLGITGSHYTRLNFLQRDRKRRRKSIEQLQRKEKRNRRQRSIYQQNSDYGAGICADSD